MLDNEQASNKDWNLQSSGSGTFSIAAHQLHVLGGHMHTFRAADTLGDPGGTGSPDERSIHPNTCLGDFPQTNDLFENITWYYNSLHNEQLYGSQGLMTEAPEHCQSRGYKSFN